MKCTIEQVLLFRINAQQYLNVKQSNPASGWNKFCYALSKMVARTNEIQKNYEYAVQDFEIDCASVDKNGNLIYNDGRLSFTPEKKKEFNHKIREYLQTQVEVEPYKAESFPNDLINEELKSIFAPFVQLEYGE